MCARTTSTITSKLHGSGPVVGIGRSALDIVLAILANPLSRTPVMNSRSPARIDGIRGFTLTEVLIVLAIILTLLAIVAPATVRARLAGYRAAEFENLRTLGQAAILYHDDQGCWLLSTKEMDSAGLNLPRSIFYSPADPFRRGYANEVVAVGANGLSSLSANITSYPRTYVGNGDFGLDSTKFSEFLESRPGAGLLVAIHHGIPMFKGDLFYMKGKYKRLLLDSSVATRDFGRIRFTRRGQTWVLFKALFADGDDRWLEELTR